MKAIRIVVLLMMLAAVLCGCVRTESEVTTEPKPTTEPVATTEPEVTTEPDGAEMDENNGSSASKEITLDDINLEGNWQHMRVSEYSADRISLSWYKYENGAGTWTEVECFERSTRPSFGTAGYWYRSTTDSGWYASIRLWDTEVVMNIVDVPRRTAWCMERIPLEEVIVELPNQYT